MSNLSSLCCVLIMLSLVACKSESNSGASDEVNPAVEGFNDVDSDESAIAIADEVMEAMGGRAAWDASRYIGWTFFGRRSHLWDKQGKKNRLEIPNDSLVMIINLEDKTGQVSKNGIKVTNADTIAKYIDQGYKMWINDSYWLVMPFKLKDSGVTLKSIGQDTTTLGSDADVLELTFAEVGVTPENKYKVYVDKTSRLVSQWDFYTKYSDTISRFQSPWPNYKKYGDLLLSGGQIAGNQLTDIKVTQSVDKGLFEVL